jgi:CheY-like chemotaxis protein
MQTRILLIDDDPYTRKLFEGLLRNGAVELQTAVNVAEGR